MPPRDLILYLPVGPSVNSLWNNVTRNGRGRPRVPTKQYRDWKRSARSVIAMQLSQWKPIENTCKLDIRLERPTANSDLSNRIKALEDCLVDNKIITDDKLIGEIRIQWVQEVRLPSELSELVVKIARIRLQEL